MTKTFARIFFATILLFAASSAIAQPMQTIKHGKYTLHVSGNSSDFPPALAQKLIDVFFIVYPKLAKEYNRKTLKEVTFFIDTAYHGVAETGNGKVTFSAAYMTKHPADIDVVTHEVMHIVQNYGDDAGPGWLTEGIADFARNKFGVDNAGANWSMPAYKAGQSYTNAYRITARFLTWIENKQQKGSVKKLDAALRAHTFTDASWAAITGKPLEELWTAYTKDPAL